MNACRKPIGPGVVAHRAQARGPACPGTGRGSASPASSGSTTRASTMASSMAVDSRASSESAVASDRDDERRPRAARAWRARRRPRTRHRTATPAAGSSSATASPVTRSSAPTPIVLLFMSREPSTARTRVRSVDLDAYVPAHRAEWQRLEELSRRRRLTGAETDELVERYQRVATHLSVVRSVGARPHPGRLSLLAAGPGAQPVGGHPDDPGPSVAAFFTERSRPRCTGCAGGGW